MCFYARRATVSRRRSLLVRQAPTFPPLAMLDLSKPGERQAHDFLLWSTNRRDRIWTLLSLRRWRDVLLCVVRWVHPENRAWPYALAEVSLTEIAIRWRSYATVKAARAELTRRCANSPLARAST